MPKKYGANRGAPTPLGLKDLSGIINPLNQDYILNKATSTADHHPVEFRHYTHTFGF